MDAEYLLGSLLRGVLTGRGGRKKTSKALRFVLGNRRIVGAGALALGGLAYQLLESMKQGTGPFAAGGPIGTLTPPVGTGPPGAAPPPLPVREPSASAAGQVVPPPLPPQAVAPAVPPDLMRVIRLSISAASADGVLTAAEREAILTQARAVGAESLVARDLLDPPAIADLVAGVPEGAVRQQLYTIAYAIVRADEHVADGERGYLQQLAAHLGLGEADVAALERDANAGISAAGAGGPDSE